MTFSAVQTSPNQTSMFLQEAEYSPRVEARTCAAAAAAVGGDPSRSRPRTRSIPPSTQQDTAAAQMHRPRSQSTQLQNDDASPNFAAMHAASEARSVPRQGPVESPRGYACDHFSPDSPVKRALSPKSSVLASAAFAAFLPTGGTDPFILESPCNQAAVFPSQPQSGEL